MTAASFEDSRRLTGPNLYFASPGAVLEVTGEAPDAALVAAWAARVARARARLGWPAAPVVARPHHGGAALAIAAPFDQLFTATEVNEWAWCAALAERSPGRREALEAALRAEAGEAPPPVLEEGAALERLAALAARESRPDLATLVAASEARGLPWLVDERALTIGLGSGAQSWPLDGLPRPAAVDWVARRAVPVALVTGSNGKTTTVRLVAACVHAGGRTPGYCCTDGVFVDGERVAAGDYSGPEGARRVLRDARVEAAVLETARGGILRRGLATSRADVAVVTNVSADHFGEYGIDDLEALADAKLTVAAALGPRGLLVLNAADPTLAARVATGRLPSLGWFAEDDAADRLWRHRDAGGATCGAAAGRLWLSRGGERHDLGAVDAMPLSAGGSAGYNIANLAAAALVASGLGVPPATIARVFATFGGAPGDNPGRLERYELGGVRLLVDYAHNPAGLSGVLRIAAALRSGGRVGLLLGQAGNRGDADIERLAATAARFRPDLVVVKEIDGYQRGRPEGEAAGVLRAALLRAGLPEDALPLHLRELDAARCALQWARPGDVLVLLVHSAGARAALGTLLERLAAAGWEPGMPLPD